MILLPSRAPELNQVENIWQYLRQNWRSKRVFNTYTYDNIVDAACDAWRKLILKPDIIPRSARANGPSPVKDEGRWYYLSNLPPDTTLKQLATTIKARWVCEQAHQQLKEELGLDHFEGRSWRGLHHHALLCQLAFAFLQHLRLGGKKRRHHPARARTAAATEPARHPAAHPGRAHPRPAALPPLPAALRPSPPALNMAG